MSKVVIVGGVAGGATAAARLRRLDEKAEIIVFERSGYVSYANCGLPYYLGDVITEKNALTLQTPESFNKRFNIDVKTNHEVKKIDRIGHTVTAKNLLTGEILSVEYDKLILSPGARPIHPDISGTDSEKIFVLRTVEDTFKIKEYFDNNAPDSVVISGGGFIGLELAENFKKKGMNVTVIQRGPQLMKQFDNEIASFIHAKLCSEGIDLLLNETIEKINESEGRLDIRLNSKTSINADMLIMAIGVEPEGALAKNAGLDMGIKGSILVNEHMQTSDPDIYAVGDAVQVKNYISGKDALISLAGPANRQGRIAADNICGIKSTYPGSQATSIIKLFEMSFASTGINERTAALAGLNFDKVILSPLEHAGYYPGGSAMTMKIIFEKDTDRLLGAQIAGYGGVDKRIDVLATAMYAGIKASKLKELDLAYAPPYSSAKDPVNMAGFMIENINNGIMKQFFYEDLERVTKMKDATLIDARTPDEYNRGHFEGFINIPVDELRNRINEIDKNKPAYVMCQSGLRSYIACRILAGHDIDSYNFSGGYRLVNVMREQAQVSKNTHDCGANK